MIGDVYTRTKANGGGTFRCTGVDAENRWILQREDEFESPIAPELSEFRQVFAKSAAAPAPEVNPDAEQEGWNRLSAEEKLTNLATRAAAGRIHVGDERTAPHFDGHPVSYGTETKESVRRLRAFARQMAPKEPTPEEVFAGADADALTAEVDRIWNSDQLATYELGKLDVSPSIAKALDRRIHERNRLADRNDYPNHHVVE